MNLPTVGELTTKASELNNPKYFYWNDFKIYWRDLERDKERYWNEYDKLYLFLKKLSKLTDKEIFGHGSIKLESCCTGKICLSYTLYTKNRNEYKYRICPDYEGLYKTVIGGMPSEEYTDLHNRGVYSFERKSVKDLYNEIINLLLECPDV